MKTFYLFVLFTDALLKQFHSVMSLGNYDCNRANMCFLCLPLVLVSAFFTGKLFFLTDFFVFNLLLITSDLCIAVLAGQLRQAGLSVSEESIVKQEFFAKWTFNTNVN